MAFTLSGEVWPVEVQREVAPRAVAKWAKSLELSGRLALVLYHAEARRKQRMLLFEARYKLPVGSILLSSIEAMEAGGWVWEELTTPRSKPSESKTTAPLFIGCVMSESKVVIAPWR